MKVKKLISELKKMPRDWDVGMAMGDNAEGEVADWVNYVDEMEVLDYTKEEEKSWAGPTKKTGNMIVILRG